MLNLIVVTWKLVKCSHQQLSAVCMQGLTAVRVGTACSALGLKTPVEGGIILNATPAPVIGSLLNMQVPFIGR